MSDSDAASCRVELPQLLTREVGLAGATLMGLGSMIGTGVFVSIGNAAGSAGSAASLLLAIVLAGLVAACNGLSSAQLAAAHPVSGGTYEYGYRWLHPSLGFIAGWMFVCAKSASAATAALGLAGYLLSVLGAERTAWQIPLGLAAVLLIMGLVLCGIRVSNGVNAVIVSITLLSLVLFIVTGWLSAPRTGFQNSAPQIPAPARGWSGFLEAAALMFVAYTGYGRIATLGEEIRDPQRNIPLTIGMTLLVSMLLYVGVGFVAVTTVGSDALAASARRDASPLEYVARQFDWPGAGRAVAVGAITSMLGVLLNLVLGLSRVLLAMGRRRDMPASLASLDRRGVTPFVAVLAAGVVIAGFVLSGNVQTTWSFSAFTVLIYYALTNLTALRLNAEERRYPRLVAWLGLSSCVVLAFRVEYHVWLSGLGLIASGMCWWWCARQLARWRRTNPPAI